MVADLRQLPLTWALASSPLCTSLTKAIVARSGTFDSGKASRLRAALAQMFTMQQSATGDQRDNVNEGRCVSSWRGASLLASHVPRRAGKRTRTSAHRVVVRPPLRQVPAYGSYARVARSPADSPGRRRQRAPTWNRVAVWTDLAVSGNRKFLISGNRKVVCRLVCKKEVVMVRFVKSPQPSALLGSQQGWGGTRMMREAGSGGVDVRARLVPCLCLYR